MTDPLFEPTELLFSYGTLQLESVQWATFGRRLEGTEDCLVGYESGWLEIADATVIEASGKSRHPIIRFTGQSSNRVWGTAFRVTGNELLNADTYEVADYKREHFILASGRNAWVYVDAGVDSHGLRRRVEHLTFREEES